MIPAPDVVSAEAVLDNYIVVLRDTADENTFNTHMQTVMSHHSDRLSASSGPSYAGVGESCCVGDFRAYFGNFHPETLDHIKNSPEVDFVERDQIMRVQAAVTQQNVPSWGLARISQRENTDLTTYHYDESGGEGVTAYVIDTGINIKHEEFEGRATWGFNATEDIDDDGAGHGTHCAGTVGGRTCGVAKKVNLVAVKVLGSDGSGTNSGVIRGIEWVTNDARRNGNSSKCVANMSLGGGFSAALNKVVDAAVQSGITFCVAAGNEGVDAKNSSPASTKSAITVAATDRNDARTSWSNFGSVVDIFAPGLDITSAWIGSTTETNTISGTSMATPHVCGLAAYLISTGNIAGSNKVTADILKLATQNIVTNPGKGSKNAFAYNGSGQ